MNITKCFSLRAIVKHNKIFFNQHVLNTCNGTVLQLTRPDNSNLRHTSTYAVKDIGKNKSWVKSIFYKIPFLNISKIKVKSSAYLLYEEIADTINHIEFIEKYNLPDTFYSWFIITELHIWMLSVRAMADGENGRHLRNYMVEALWGDVSQRVKQLGAGSGSSMKEQIVELSEQLQAALIAYDEGLQLNDMTLAGAIWRRFYQSEIEDLDHLEKLVKYVRRHIALLDNIPSESIFEKHYIGWNALGKQD